MSNSIARTHTLIRTSPKGKGQKFIGTCSLCGKENISLTDNQECENIRGLTEGETLLEVLKEGN